MSHPMIENEALTRISFFLGVFIVMAIWEWLKPRRKLSVSKSKRWLSNLSIILLNSILIRLIFPAAAIGVAAYAQQNHIGYFNRALLSHPWLAVIFSVIILDFVIYLQHVMFHAIPIFWRVHRMHHVDLDIDVTTGLRFHPIEIFLSLLIKFGAILLIGAPVLGVLIFEILLNATSMFSHSNAWLPLKLDKILRCIIVTPDMHRVHHSDIPTETNSNFGFNLSIWDRILGTYTNQPRLGHDGMTIGIKEIRAKKFCMHLLGMLRVPFIGEKHEYPINSSKH